MMGIKSAKVMVGHIAGDPRLSYGKESGTPRFYARVGVDHWQRESDGTFTKQDRTFHDLVVKFDLAEVAMQKFAKGDDFIGVQNYERAVWNDKGRLPAPDSADRNWSGTEVWAPSLAGAVRYVHAATKVPVLVSEHGVGTEDDTLRARFIPAALEGLKQAMDDGVPVLGYMHWSLLDNYEWIFGYKPRFGLCSVDRTTFARTPKPSAAVLGGIAKRNSL